MDVSVCPRSCHNVANCRSQSYLARGVSTSLLESGQRLEVGSVNAFHLTMRAVDKWESPRFLGMFLALGCFSFESDYTLPPLATNAGR